MMKAETAEQAEVLGYMVSVALSCRDSAGEIIPTKVAELAADHFDHDEWLYEETHWVWDLALHAAEVAHGSS